MTVLGYRIWAVDLLGYLRPLVARRGTWGEWDQHYDAWMDGNVVEAGHHETVTDGPGYLAEIMRLPVYQCLALGDKSIGGRHLGHAAPQLHCSCGLHAYATPRDLLAELPAEQACRPREYLVAGVVQLSGWAIRHERGWRAQRAAVRAVHDSRHRVRGHYDIARYVDLQTMLAEWYVPEDQTPWPRSPKNAFGEEERTPPDT